MFTYVIALVVLWNVYAFFAYRYKSVKGQTVLITGGGSGIGRLMALKFAKLGAKIVLWDINESGMKSVTQEITKDGGTCTFHSLDVTDRKKVYATATLVGPIDVLINNAGIVTGKSFLDCPDELMEKTVQVNTISHFWTLKAFLPSMMERNDGRIVTVASAAGLAGVNGLVDYCASKFGAVGIAESLYLELRRLKKNIRCTMVCPYYINTGMFDGVTSKFPLLPILNDDYAAQRVVDAVLYGRERVMMPWMVHVIAPCKLLPIPIAAKVMDIVGVSATMDTFRGRSGSPNKKQN